VADRTTMPTRRNSRRSQPNPVLLSQPQAWAFCGLTRTAWFGLKSANALPAAVYLPTSSRPFWRRADLEAWIAKLPTSRRESVNAG
jgi:predicted DNA-binding transcriptional regulator AlpA